MARGVALEPSAQAAYGKQLGKMVEPACLESLQYPWMRASVDGISVCGSHLVEIKCGESVYRKTAAARNPPNYYVGQLQHALAVTELEAMDFWCFLPHRPPVHVVVKRDIPYITRLIDTERRFYERHFTC